MSLTVRFVSTGVFTAGFCTNLSASGMLARFTEPLDVWITGNLAITIGDAPVTLSARVMRVDGYDAGLAFHINNDEDCRVVKVLMGHVTASEH